METKFEKSLLRSKSESDLKQVEINPNILYSYILDSLWKNLQNTVKTKERNPIIQTLQPPVSSVVQNPPVDQNPPIAQNLPRAMVARFSPLALDDVLHDLPHNYSQRITLFDGEGNFTTRQHMDRFDDFIDLEEVDYDDVKMIFFAQSLLGEAKRWFKYLPAISIATFEAFRSLFLDRWEDKKNPLQILAQ